MAEKKLAFQLSAGLATNVLTESQYIKAGYIVVQSIAERNSLVTADQEILVAGSPVYVANEGKTYRFIPGKATPAESWADDQATSKSFVYRGEVTYAEDLPSTALDGDIYKVAKIKGTGTDPDYNDGHNYFADIVVDAANGTSELTWKLMSGIDSDQYVNDRATTIALGGIEKGTTFEESEGWTLKKLVDTLLYPYVPFTFESMGTAPASGTFEYGTAKEIESVTNSYTLGSVAMTSLKVGTTTEGSDLLNTTTVPASGAAAALETKLNLDGTTDATVYVTLEDEKGTKLSKSVDFKFTKSIYYTHQASATDIPTTATKGNGVAITVADDDYVLFLAPDKTKTHIQQNTMGEWNNIDTTYVGEQTNFVNAAGKKVTYYAYRTDKLNAASYTLRLV